MGHEFILVIGDNFRDQLDKYQRTEFAQPTNPYLVAADYLERAQQEFAIRSVKFYRAPDGALHDYWSEAFYHTVDGGKVHRVPPGFVHVLIPAKERMSFTQWVKKTNGYPILQEREPSDAAGKHKLGWNRVNANGDIIEMFAPEIPDGFFDYFESTCALLKLKPGAHGTVMVDGEELPATDGYAGSARKAAIDFDGMRALVRTTAGERWDRAKAAAGLQKWKPFKAIWQKYETEKFSLDLHNAAAREWTAQPAVKAIIDDCRIFPLAVIRVASQPATDVIEAHDAENAHWQQLSELERSAHALTWNDHTASGIDPRALSREDYVQRFRLRHLLGYGEVIINGELSAEPDEEKLLNSIAENAVLTLAMVHC